MKLTLDTKYDVNASETYAEDLANEIAQTVQELSDLQEVLKNGADTTDVDQEFISNLKALDFNNLKIGLETNSDGVTILTLE